MKSHTHDNILSNFDKANHDLLKNEGGALAPGDDKGVDVVLTEDSQFKAYVEAKNREERSDS